MSDDEHHHTFVPFGTPLQPLSEDEVLRKKPVPIEEQIATDERGRRRFHGAFTGGFSAGYFNSVGSKHGWRPAEFKSSRSEKAKGKGVSQKPEDFMDEEDMGEFGILHKTLKTSSTFHQEPKGQDTNWRSTVSDILGGQVLNDILKPASDTIGVKLLRSMGWKPGQGIGPRITRSHKKRLTEMNQGLAGRRIEGSANEGAQDEEDDEHFGKYRDFLFAPDDVPHFVLNPKDNMNGIGYHGLDKRTLFTSSSSGHINLFDMSPQNYSKRSSSHKHPEKPHKTMRIGGQAFGVGVYEEEDEDIYAKEDLTQYDFSLASEEPSAEAIHSRKKSRWDRKEEEEPVCIDGFEMDAEGEDSSGLLKSLYPPPDIPKHWRPKLFVDHQPLREVHHIPLDPNQRAELVGEVSRTYVSDSLQEDASLSQTSFKPFSTDPQKQKRYELFLKHDSSGRDQALFAIQPTNMTDWERDKERIEFQRAAQLFRPLQNSMSSRFVGASTDDQPQTETQSNQITKAVEMKIFGKLTRELVDWIPAKILCIRFNVKCPYGDESVEEDCTSRPSQSSKFDIFGNLTKPVERDNSRLPVTTSTISAVFIEKETSEWPTIDVFKSIFLDSDDDDSNDEEEGDCKKRDDADVGPKPSQEDSEPESNQDHLQQKSSCVEQSVTSVTKSTGLFAGVDLDRLNSKLQVPFLSPLNPPVPKRPDSEDEEPLYGPAKPAINQISSRVWDSVHDATSSSSASSSDQEWAEKSASKGGSRLSSDKKRKKERKKKSKEKSKKKKKSKKDHKRYR